LKDAKIVSIHEEGKFTVFLIFVRASRNELFRRNTGIFINVSFADFCYPTIIADVVDIMRNVIAAS